MYCLKFQNQPKLLLSKNINLDEDVLGLLSNKIPWINVDMITFIIESVLTTASLAHRM